MPDSLFANRPLRRGRLAVMVVGSLLVHGTLVGIAALMPSRNSYDIPVPVTELGLDDKLGEEVQQLIVKDEPSPPPDVTPEPTPPPPDPTPPEETPPPTEDPDMDMPDPPKPTPALTPKPKASRPVATPAPANAKRGPVAQPGQVDGNVTKSDKLSGNVGGARVGSGGWKTPRPNYPYQARAARVQGSGSVRVSTDGSGRVISASIVASVGNGILDANTIAFAKSNWHGPPNTTTTVPITYKLQ